MRARKLPFRHSAYSRMPIAGLTRRCFEEGLALAFGFLALERALADFARRDGPRLDRRRAFIKRRPLASLLGELGCPALAIDTELASLATNPTGPEGDPAWPEGFAPLSRTIGASGNPVGLESAGVTRSAA